MVDEVLVMQRLLDHQQVERVERREHGEVGERVGGVRVDREQDVGVRVADGAHHARRRARVRSSA